MLIEIYNHNESKKLYIYIICLALFVPMKIIAVICIRVVLVNL